MTTTTTPSSMPASSPASTASTADLFEAVLARRPKRADARRNYEALLAAAHDVFAERGADGALEEIARRADVGIGTLYRHFPTRQDLLEAVYVNEVDQLCRTAADVADAPPWDALVAWIHRFVEYTATKRAIIEELAKGSPLFQGCRAGIVATGTPLLARAQDAGLVRRDITFDDVLRLFSGVTAHPFAEADQQARVLGVAIDGLRPRT
jgi:AcrR family transcriptional regulator